MVVMEVETRSFVYIAPEINPTLTEKVNKRTADEQNHHQTIFIWSSLCPKLNPKLDPRALETLCLRERCVRPIRIGLVIRVRADDKVSFVDHESGHPRKPAYSLISLSYF